MTIGIALKDKEQNRIIIGSDKQSTIGDIKNTVKGSKHVCKTINIIDGYCNNIATKEIHFLLAGYGFLENYIKYTLEIPEINENQDFIEYLYNNLLEELREQLIDKKLLGTREDRFDSDSNIIIIYDGEIYEIDSHFGIEMPKDYAVIGSGWRVAIGSLYTNLHYHLYMDKVDVVKQAIVACGVNTIYCDTNTDITIIDDL